MDVRLLTVTPNALDVLLFTKQTRLRMTADGLAEVAAWPESRKVEELRYMRNTIQSSWEFVDYVFAITGVTRAFTHQLVRHRVGTSFAQQAQRVVNMEGFEYLVTGEAMTGRSNESFTFNANAEMHLDDSTPFATYADTMRAVSDAYSDLTAKGVKPQDARGVLPTNICTNIVFKANLRTLHDMALKRLCVKAQGEFQDVFRLLVDRVIEVHPWVDSFLRVQCAWNGTCLFPSLPVSDCHVKPYVYNPETTRSYGQDEEVRREGMTPASYGALAPKPISELYHIHRAKRTEIQPTIAPEPVKPEEELVLAFMRDGRAGANLAVVRQNLTQPRSVASLDEAARRLDAEGPAMGWKCSECGATFAGNYRAGDPCPEGRVGSCCGTLS